MAPLVLRGMHDTATPEVLLGNSNACSTTSRISGHPQCKTLCCLKFSIVQAKGSCVPHGLRCKAQEPLPQLLQGDLSYM